MFGIRMSGRRCFALLLFAAGCHRPVDRSFGDRVIGNAKVVPEHLRANVPFDVSFAVLGQRPESVDLEFTTETSSCAPVLHEDQRFHCAVAGLDANTQPNGTNIVLVHAKASGQLSTISASFVFDSECPRVASLTVDPQLAQPGDRVTVRITANENLRVPPLVSRAGRDWEAAEGAGREFTVLHEVTPFDPAIADVVVKLEDAAGNESATCGTDGRVALEVDRTAPVAQPELIRLFRGAPGEGTSIEADDTAFMDDVGVVGVKIVSIGSEGVIATFVPNARGGLARTTLPVTPSGRVLVQPVDVYGREGEAMSISETWTVGFGPSATAARAIRTATRYSPAAPNTTSMNHRTEELASTIALSDAHAATIRAEIGFKKVGELPGRYQNAHQIVGGYDAVGKTAIAVGGRLWDASTRGTSFLEDTMLIEWAQEDGNYRTRPGPDLYLGPAPQLAPSPRAGMNIAFDGTGCGMMFGGEGLYYHDNDDPSYFVEKDLWRMCRNGNNYDWEPIVPENDVDGPYYRITPIVWDPLGERFVIVGGRGDCFFGCPAGDDVYFLAQETNGNWRWHPYLTLPSNFDGHIYHAAWFDTRLGTPVIAFGLDEFFAGTASRIWRYEQAEWRFTTITSDLYFRQGFGWAYDIARGQTVLWGGSNETDVIPQSGDMNPDPTDVRYTIPDPLVYLLTGTASTGPSGWVSRDLNYPTPRMWPTMVYDEDREVELVFGGTRFHDTTPVDGSIYELVVEPAYPYLQAIVDLAAARPKGIDTLSLSVRAAGSGGVTVELWDYAAEAWVEIATSASSGFETLEVSFPENVDRFVSPEGTVPVTVRARASATSRAEARLEVDSIRGEITLRAGVTLP